MFTVKTYYTETNQKTILVRSLNIIPYLIFFSLPGNISFLISIKLYDSCKNPRYFLQGSLFTTLKFIKYGTALHPSQCNNIDSLIKN